MKQLKLGVNIDHVATVRNARGGCDPDPLRAAMIAQKAGADGITVHLREDRRHITDQDVAGLVARLTVPLNLEMAATAEMQAIALTRKPHAVCLVPERRQERTTEGGIDCAGNRAHLASFIHPLQAIGCSVSLFIDPVPDQVKAAAAIGADTVELHTGPYAEACIRGDAGEMTNALQQLSKAAALADRCALTVHAGHGLTYQNVRPISAITVIRELNIGHFLIGEAIFIGLDAAISQMKQLINREE